jgi:predicted nucleic acid-binding protein
MKYVVDTSVWSLALRKKGHRKTEEVRKLSVLLKEGERVFVPGIILQEVLQGIRNPKQFLQIKEALGCFPSLETSNDDHMFAAELFNTCRAKGIQASTIDFLIASIVIRNDCILLSADKDFLHISKHCELKLL